MAAVEAATAAVNVGVAEDAVATVAAATAAVAAADLVGTVSSVGTVGRRMAENLE